MKRKLLLFSVCFVFAANYLIAQNSGSGGDLLSRFDFGVKMGLNSSRLLVESAHFTAPKIGFQGGVFAEFRIIDAVSVSFEPMYMEQGANDINPQCFYSIFSPLLTGLDRMDVRLKSISLPLLVNAVIPSEGLQPKFFAGASFDLYNWAYTYNRHIFTYNSVEKPSVTRDDITDRVKQLGISGIVGAGIVKKMDPLVLSVDLRYMIGLRNINNVPDYPLLNNSTFALTLGIGF
jgi:hypothetical protein